MIIISKFDNVLLRHIIIVLIMTSLLANKNNHERDSHITFEEEPHIYTIDGDSDYTSVTTLISKHFEHFNADKIITKMMNGRNWRFSKYYGMTREEIKQKWETTRIDAATSGTKMHYDIECYYNKMQVDNTSIEYYYFKDFCKDYAHLNPYRSEWMIWDNDLKLAGSVDMLFENADGTLSIYDWKRCKEIKKTNKWQSSTTQFLKHIPDTNFWHYSLQLNIYKYLLEKNYTCSIKDMCLVCMHPNNKNKSYIHLEVPDLQKEVRDIMTARKKIVSNL